MFAAFSAEERGLIGSRHMADHLDDLAVKSARVVAMINLDVIGRLKPGGVRVQGVNSGDRWPEIVRRASKQAKLDVLSRGSALTGSDHLSFYRKGAPVLHVCTGYGADLHTPRDTPDKINAAGAVRVLGLVEAIVSELWTMPEPPAYKPPEWFGRFAGGAYLGVRADPASASATEGCKLLEVLPDTPAGKAGLRAGNVVVAWNGKATPDLRAMLSQVWAGKAGDLVKLKVRRDGKVIQITVKLGRR